MARRARKVDWGRFIQAGLIGGVIATIINLLLYIMGNALNGGPMMIDVAGPPPLEPLAVFSVIMLSLVPGLLAGILYALLTRFTKNAGTIFVIVAVIVFAVFFIGPLGAAQSTVTLWILQLMHLGAAVPIVLLLLRADRVRTKV